MNKQIDIQESREQILARDLYTCQRCWMAPGIENLQIAHRIKQGSGSIKHIQLFWKIYFDRYISKNYAEEILHHPLNLVTTCSESCNSSFNIFFSPVKVEKLLKRIYEELPI